MENKPKFVYDIKTGRYTYTDESGNKTIYQSLKKQKGKWKEAISKKTKQKIIQRLVEKGLKEEDAKKVDYNIYLILNRYHKDKLDSYISSLEDNSVDKGFSIEYDLRKRKNAKIGKRYKGEKKLSLPEKNKIIRNAINQEKAGNAIVKKDKKKNKFLAALYATVGLTIFAGIGTKLLNQNNNIEENKTQTEDTIDDKNETNESAYAENENEGIFNIEEFEATEIEILDGINKEEISSLYKEGYEELEASENESTWDLGEYVEVDLGTHLYQDPYDAIMEQLNKEPLEKITTKTKYKDRTYQITREGFFCPDGKCIEIEQDKIYYSNGKSSQWVEVEDGNLEIAITEALKNAGMDSKVIGNIDSEELKEQGYKHMYLLVADGISEWVVATDTTTSEKQYATDQFGNRLQKSDEEVQAENEPVSSVTQEKCREIEH